MMKLKMSLVFSILMTQAAWAGVVHGGGAVSVVCRDEQGKIQKAELLDLYEAKLSGLKLVTDENLASNYGRFMSRWIELNGGTPVPMNETEQYNQINDFFIQHVYMTSPGQKPPSLGDFTTGVLPAGCKTEQSAVFYDGPVFLLIDGEIWNAFTQQSRAALLAHEIVYRNDRLVYGSSDSNRSRKLVGRLFSTTPLYRQVEEIQ